MFDRMRNAISTRVAVAISLGMALALALPCAGASAVTYDIDSTPDELAQKVDDTAKAYDDAVAKVDELQQKIDENQSKIDEVSSQIPAQKDKSASAIKSLYKLQQDTPGLVSLLLASDDFNQFLTNYHYMEIIQGRVTDEAYKLSEMEQELEDTQAELDSEKAEADSEKDAAATALAEAQAARQKAQEEAIAKAQAEAAAQALAQQQAQEQAAADAAAATTGDSSTADSSSTGSVSSPTTGGVDWSLDKQGFVNEWAPRIDSYLSGSPLSGHGSTFAAAAWDYGVDPRWSPAISNTESSKGLYCFQPHNAWGWGDVSWDDWDTAIYAHVKGLSSGYGYTISISAAKKYCPPTYMDWYEATLSQMQMI
ncbi:MAG: hypothetical protein LKI25_07460 [Atopobiaceae bacterium]|jgi:peptidoglycan hydrolase CwlO-like protein|nr:hypothetical protein [Atopobiaceae bacterium]